MRQGSNYASSDSHESVETARDNSPGQYTGKLRCSVVTLETLKRNSSLLRNLTSKASRIARSHMICKDYLETIVTRVDGRVDEVL